jgi:hypothetical protein
MPKLEKNEIELCARAAHEMNRSFCALQGDSSHKSWDDTSEDLKQTARLSVVNIVEFDFNAEKTHEAWVNDKVARGYQLGAKDDVKKTHPCLLPFAQLAFEIQAKDKLWVSVVKEFMTARWSIPTQ